MEMVKKFVCNAVDAVSRWFLSILVFSLVQAEKYIVFLKSVLVETSTHKANFVYIFKLNKC